MITNPLQKKAYDAVGAALPFPIDPAKITVEPGLSYTRSPIKAHDYAAGLMSALASVVERIPVFGLDPEAGPPSFGEFVERIHPEDRAPSLEALENASRAGRDFDLQYRIVLPNGTTRHVYGTAHPVFNSTGGVTGFVGIVMDITERKRAEEARLEERVRERTRIARELHDTLLQNFHAPLLYFQAAINLLPERPDEARKILESALDQAQQAVTEGRDAIQGLRAEIAGSNLAAAIRTLGEELAAGETNRSSAVFDISVIGTPREVHTVLCEEAYRIVREALSN